MFVSRTDYGVAMNSTIFFRENLWDEFGPTELKPYPNCTLRGVPVGAGKMSRVLGDSLSYGPFKAQLSFELSKMH